MTPEEWAKSVVDRLPELVQYKNRLTLVTDVVAAAQQEARAAALEEAAAEACLVVTEWVDSVSADAINTHLRSRLRALLEGK